jgi:hypothetical protein
MPVADTLIRYPDTLTSRQRGRSRTTHERNTFEHGSIGGGKGEYKDGTREIGIFVVVGKQGAGMVVKRSSPGAEGDAVEVVLDHPVDVDDGDGIADFEASGEGEEAEEGEEEGAGGVEEEESSKKRHGSVLRFLCCDCLSETSTVEKKTKKTTKTEEEEEEEEEVRKEEEEEEEENECPHVLVIYRKCPCPSLEHCSFSGLPV